MARRSIQPVRRPGRPAETALVERIGDACRFRFCQQWGGLVLISALKRLVPSPIRPALRGCGTTSLSRSCAGYGAYVLRITNPPEGVRRAVAEQVGVSAPDMAICRDDLMYHYLARAFQAKGEPADDAMTAYMTSGHHMLRVVEAAVHRHFGGWAGVDSFLDFASGHGRLTCGWSEKCRRHGSGSQTSSPVRSHSSADNLA